MDEESEYDSGEDLFITSFRTDTQNAGNAAEFLETSFNLSVDYSTPEIVQYWDFSKDNSTSDDVSKPAGDVSSHIHVAEGVVQNSTASLDDNVAIGEEPILPLVPAFDSDTVEQLSDEVVSAALDDAVAVLQSSNRFGAPVSDGTVQQSSVKGYVSH